MIPLGSQEDPISMPSLVPFYAHRILLRQSINVWFSLSEQQMLKFQVALFSALYSTATLSTSLLPLIVLGWSKWQKAVLGSTIFPLLEDRSLPTALSCELSLSTMHSLSCPGQCGVTVHDHRKQKGPNSVYSQSIAIPPWVCLINA